MRWDPYRGVLDRAVVAASDVVINLAGAPIAHWPWTSGYKEKILQSRLATGGTIAAAIAEVENRPAWVNASGDRLLRRSRRRGPRRGIDQRVRLPGRGGPAVGGSDPAGSRRRARGSA